METQDLIKRIADGDEMAFENLFRIFYKPLCAYAFNFLKDSDSAEEIVQDVLVHIWQSRKTFQIETAIRAYLYRAVHNRCMNFFRHEAVKQHYQSYKVALSEQSYEAAGSRLALNELKHKIDEGLETLPPACRQIFRLSRMEGLSYKEIADLLEISVKTVENQMGKALKLMRIHLADFLTWCIFLSLINNFVFTWGYFPHEVF
jgi:RNA polymerase sigma-70 factor (ECF subfamily)